MFKVANYHILILIKSQSPHSPDHITTHFDKDVMDLYCMGTPNKIQKFSLPPIYFSYSTDLEKLFSPNYPKHFTWLAF